MRSLARRARSSSARPFGSRTGWTSLPCLGSARSRARQARREASSDSGGVPDRGDSDFLRRALEEAAELFRSAQQLAEQQARSELAQSWLADGGGGGGFEEGFGGAAGAVTPRGDEGRGEDEGAARRTLAAFLVEQGLGEARAARLAGELLSSPPGEAPCSLASGSGGGGAGAGAADGAKRGRAPAPASRPTIARLRAQLLALGRVLPDADVADMVAREPGLLHAGTTRLVAAMVALVRALPGRDVLGMAQALPGLLLLEDLPERCERVAAQLLELHPSRDPEVIAALLEENPSLLLRMDYYRGATLLDELPVEIQNMMIPPGDMGIGWLYRHYARKQAPS